MRDNEIYRDKIVGPTIGVIFNKTTFIEHMLTEFYKLLDGKELEAENAQEEIMQDLLQHLKDGDMKK